jgi:integrase
VITRAKYLDDNEQQALIQLLRKHSSRDSTMLLLLLHTGARATELLNCRQSDLSNGALLIRGIKGSRDREIPLPTWLYQLAIQNAANGAPGASDAKLFNISYPRLYQIWCYWRPCKKKLHSLRHTFAINLYQKTKDINFVQRALGHKSILNTMVYQEFLYTQEHWRKAFGC